MRRACYGLFAMRARRVAVCHVGIGNVRSVVRAVAAAAPGADVVETRDAGDLSRADVLVVPGQGSFGAFARAMSEGGVGDVLAARLREGRPYLGICLGMQVLFEASEEAEGARGLARFGGRVRRLAPGVDPATGRPRPLPHVGWNVVAPAPGAAPTVIEAPFYAYFAHSYAVVPDDASIAAAETDYGERFVSAVAAPGLLGVQFHPEKSQEAGLALLRRFFETVEA